MIAIIIAVIIAIVIVQDPPQLCKFNIEHGRHQKEATGVLVG